MNGEQFERYVAQNILPSLGFSSIALTRRSADYGVDIIAFKNNVKYGIQCKYYSNKVGVSAVQEVASGVQYYSCSKGMVITNNEFTKNAIELAKHSNIELLGYSALETYYNRYPIKSVDYKKDNNEEFKIPSGWAKPIWERSNTNCKKYNVSVDPVTGWAVPIYVNSSAVDYKKNNNEDFKIPSGWAKPIWERKDDTKNE